MFKLVPRIDNNTPNVLNESPINNTKIACKLFDNAYFISTDAPTRTNNIISKNNHRLL